ncbi:SPFH domain-containing protein [Aquitalea magnusonii]|uniref:Regulator of protease activity HflC (Stomatin/prohibitin superfamily) n=1 Tax=Aquitalea magnusonii TaxID=332411 RepID=A0A318JLD6_9NEIS|nr:SPFH domain-containing protein [Aquitalea magnusonii]PXX48693.1 regulator of protease activity HflC (stomatin/prohibitin superfamily) [Aquitalea magnusonii]
MKTPATPPPVSADCHHERRSRGGSLLAMLAALACLLCSLLLAEWPARLLWLSDAASLGLLAGLLNAAASRAGWRRRRQGAAALPVLPFARPAWLALHPRRSTTSYQQHQPLRRLLLWPRLRRLIGRHCGWPVIWQALGSLLALLLSLLLVQADLSAATTSGISRPSLLLPGLCGLLAAFACLLLERRLAQESATDWPEAPLLLTLSRAIILALLLPALCGLGLMLGLDWLLPGLPLAGCWLLLLSAELLLRALLSGFRPYHRQQATPPAFNSLLASLMQRSNPAQRLRRQLQQGLGLGLELRHSWALRFLGSALRPLAAGLLLCAWLLSSLSIIGTDQRGIYQRFGAAVAVWQPGLHLGLPWPLGRVSFIENGQIHQQASTLLPDDGGQNVSAGNNRLWDGQHRAESMQLIASGRGSNQSIQLMGLDVRLVYRQGLRDEDALALYRLSDAPALLHSLAQQTMLHYFAGQQLDQLLGEGLSATSLQLRNRIQQQLDRSAAGIELLAVVIQAIHPPAAAANAYHGVQAAQILAQANVAAERAQAVRSHSAAVQAALRQSAAASAAAAEQLAASRADAIAFQADQQAYQLAGQTFLLERYLHALAHGLSHTRPLIIDHRIPAAALPTIDLRPAGTAPTLPGVEVKPPPATGAAARAAVPHP